MGKEKGTIWNPNEKKKGGGGPKGPPVADEEAGPRCVAAPTLIGLCACPLTPACAQQSRQEAGGSGGRHEGQDGGAQGQGLHIVGTHPARTPGSRARRLCMRAQRLSLRFRGARREAARRRDGETARQA